MNHKRNRPKSQRAGCTLCKPYKHQRFGKSRAEREIAGAGGFGKIRAAVHARADLMEATR